MKSASNKTASKSGEPKRAALPDRPDAKADAKSQSGGAAAADAKPTDAEDVVEFDELADEGTESSTKDLLFNYAAARLDFQRLHRIFTPQLYVEYPDPEVTDSTLPERVAAIQAKVENGTVTDAELEEGISRLTEASERRFRKHSINMEAASERKIEDAVAKVLAAKEAAALQAAAIQAPAPAPVAPAPAQAAAAVAPTLQPSIGVVAENVGSTSENEYRF